MASKRKRSQAQDNTTTPTEEVQSEPKVEGQPPLKKSCYRYHYHICYIETKCKKSYYLFLHDSKITVKAFKKLQESSFKDYVSKVKFNDLSSCSLPSNTKKCIQDKFLPHQELHWSIIFEKGRVF